MSLRLIDLILLVLWLILGVWNIATWENMDHKTAKHHYMLLWIVAMVSLMRIGGIR